MTSWRFHNRAWQPQRHDRLPETSGTLWIHRGALTNQRCSLATGYGIIQSLLYHACWYPADARSQGISRHGIDLLGILCTLYQKGLHQHSVFPQAAADQEDKSSYCSLCGKHFNTKNSYENHIKSKKHKELEAKQQQKLQAQIEQLNAKNAEKGLPTEDDKIAEKNLKNEALKASLRQSTDVSQSGPSGTKPKATPSGSKVGAKPSSAADEGMIPMVGLVGACQFIHLS